MRRRPLPDHARDTHAEPAAVRDEPEPVPAPEGLSAQAVLGMQRTHGNQAVARMLSQRTIQRVNPGEEVQQGQKRKREPDDAEPEPKRRMVAEDMTLDAPAPQDPDEVELDEPGVPKVIGNWTRMYNTPKLRYWKHSSGLYHFSQFPKTGDWHMKGDRANKAYRRGYFTDDPAASGAAPDGWLWSRVLKQGQHGQTQKSVSQAKVAAAEPLYAECMNLLLPLLANQKPARYQ